MSYSNSVDVPLCDTESRSNFENVAKVLLIGETGVGKSTLINYLTNYFHHGSLKNLKIAIPCKHHPFPTETFAHYESNIHDNTQSKTNSCISYMFTDTTTRRQYLFLDTPGLSDTRSSEQSDTNMNKMIDAITAFGDLTSIIIVVNGSQSRLTPRLRTIISVLNGNLPDVVLENVIVILTNVKKHESPFDLHVLNLRGNVYPFYMQNGALVSDPRTWRKSVLDELQYDWEHSMHQIKCILQTIDSFQQLSTESFVQMRQIRNEIKSTMHQARLEMIQIQKVQDELSRLDRAFQQADRDTMTYQDRIRSQTMEKLAVVDAIHHSTLCAECNQVCHNHCRLDETTTVGAQILTQCVVMLNGQCQQCRGHCSYRDHYHAKKTIQATRESLQAVLNDLTQKKDRANADRSDYQGKLLTVAESKQLLEKALKEKVTEIKTKSVKLCQICSSFNLAREFKHFIKQLTAELDCLQNLELKKQMESCIKSLKKFAHLVEENQEKNRQKRPPMQLIDREQPLKEKPIDLKSQKTSDLIELYGNTTDHLLIAAILNELHQRAQGKSTGPLATAEQIPLIGKYLEEHNHKSVEQLSLSYHRLQQQIHRIIEDDVLKLIHVRPELLIEACVVQSALSGKEKNENNLHDTPSDAALRSFPHATIHPVPHSIYSTPYPTTGPALPQAPTTSHPPSHPNAPAVPFPPTGSPPYPHARKPSNLTSTSIGFSHLMVTPYPSHDDSSPMPALPDHYTPTIKESQPQEPLYPRTTSARSSSEHLDHMLMPMPTADQLPSNRLWNGSFRSSADNGREHERLFSSDKHSSQPDVVPTPSLAKDPEENTVSFDKEDLHLMENSRLLSMYAAADLEKNVFRKKQIHQELERRCEGEHPLLMMEKRSLLHDKLIQYETKTVEELAITLLRTQRKIREHLKNGDVIFIDDVPPELIVEAYALLELIRSKTLF